MIGPGKNAYCRRGTSELPACLPDVLTCCKQASFVVDWTGCRRGGSSPLQVPTSNGF